MSGGLAEAGGGQVLLAQRGDVDVEFRVVRVGLDAELVRGVLAAPVDVLGQVRRDVGQVLRVDLSPLVQQLPHDLRDVQGVAEITAFVSRTTQTRTNRLGRRSTPQPPRASGDAGREAQDGAALGAVVGAPVQLGAEFVDDLGVDGDALAKPVVVLPQCAGDGFGLYCAGVQMLERGRDAVCLGLSAGEFFFQVNVLVCEDPALDACLGGELQRGERPRGPGWTAVEQPLDRRGDGVAFDVAVSGHRGVLRCGRGR